MSRESSELLQQEVAVSREQKVVEVGWRSERCSLAVAVGSMLLQQVVKAAGSPARAGIQPARTFLCARLAYSAMKMRHAFARRDLELMQRPVRLVQLGLGGNALGFQLRHLLAYQMLAARYRLLLFRMPL